MPTISKTVPSADASKRVVSGMRPTGALHIGHYFGVLCNWIELQKSMDTFFFVADWHALTTEYEKATAVQGFIPDMLKDWLAAGLDPEQSVIFQQSQVKEHAELHLLLSMITPTSWLERCPTYKDQIQQLADKDITTYGFLGYPVLMTADIIIYRPRWIPVGQDQLPHIELSREICRRFNHLYGDFFPEPEAHLTPAAKCPGLDGRKMSKSYNNSIYLRDTAKELEPKIKSMVTDTARVRRTDSGNPKNCNLFPYHELLSSPQEQAEITEGCTTAGIGCGDCKKILLRNMLAFFEPIHERRATLDVNPKRLKEILEAGNEKARKQAKITLEGVRERMGF